MMDFSYGKCSLKLHPASAFLVLILCSGVLLLYQERYHTESMTLNRSPKYVPSQTEQNIKSNPNENQSVHVVTMQTKNTSSIRNLNVLKTSPNPTKGPSSMSAKPASTITRVVSRTNPVMSECVKSQAPPDSNYLRDALLIGRLPSKAEMCVMSVAHLDTLMQAYMNTIQILCGSSMMRMGARKDGGWDVCPNDRYLQRNNCLVYSFGICNDFSFDDEIAQQYGCKVYSFDPSMKKKDHIRSQKPFVSFHATGLSDFNGTSNDRNRWKMRTLSGIRQDLGHTQTMPDILKMDIEFSEWNALPEIVRSTPTNDLPNQLIAEFHYFIFKTDLKTHWLKYLDMISVAFCNI
ncbi:Methyltransferase-like protein 24 [Mizuhopecten yessoensis]|uniref:Methyltransferase-like protein 24 n=1 Tax=Mizuhopecten yessoensis TaxID=6573 RepID=A0A210QP70_MIZYE|nr:Methyltransferase-like protein 24 [Mizuhopecten yessoensis]